MDNEDGHWTRVECEFPNDVNLGVQSEGGLLENSHTVSCAVSLLLARAM